MFYNPKEFLEQDLRYKGPMRRRYDELLEIYKGYNIHRYNRGEWERIGAEIKDDDLIVEADTIEEVRKWLDENVKQEVHILNENELIDFNKATEIPPEYNGSEKKKTMILGGKKYLVKFPDSNRSPKLNISYINNVYFQLLQMRKWRKC